MGHAPASSATEAAIDTLPAREALSAMLGSHVSAANAVAGALAPIEAAAELVAQTVARGGVLVYAAAGSSGLMALADASELAGTFRIPRNQVRIVMAGGVPQDGHMPGDTEDDHGQAQASAAALGADDLAIVISASGTTPFALAFAEAARGTGATVVALANVQGAALLDLGDVAIAIPTAAEIVDGSTRLGAGTAQKIALNMISTQAGILLGHVHDGMMVNLKPDNAKLRNRAADIVARIAGVPFEAAKRALERSAYDTKLATLLAAGAEIGAARDLLARHDGRLRDCLHAVRSQSDQHVNS